jgi:hypothetical protein
MIQTPERQSSYPRELAVRDSVGGLNVRLIWRPDDDAVFVVVSDPARCEQFAVQVEAANAMDAFHHPYVERTSPHSVALEATL